MINIKYQTNKGRIIEGNSIELLSGEMKEELRGKVNLIITSPPFPLNNKKKYGNEKGEEYLKWFIDMAPIFSDLLSEIMFWKDISILDKVKIGKPFQMN